MGGCGENVCALEIGTGVGVLTRELAIRTKKTVAVEIDSKGKPMTGKQVSDCSKIGELHKKILSSK